MSQYTPEEIQALLDGPGLAPPDGQESDFNSPDSIAIVVFIAAGLGLGLTTVALTIRVYTKAVIVKRFGWEDFTAILGWAMFVGFCVPCIYCSYYGGRHQWDTSLGHVFSLLYYASIVEIMYGPTVFIIKLSILLQYLRVFVPSRIASRPMYIGIHVVLWSNLICYTVDTFFEIFSCTPRALAWNKLLTGHCYNTNAAIVCTAVFNVLSDFAILFLPLYSIWTLQLKRSQKIGIYALFATGLVACICSSARLVYSVLLITSDDTTWNIIAVGSWAIAEISIGILCSCLPVIPKFIKTIGPKVLGSSSRSRLSTALKTYGSAVTRNSRNPYGPAIRLDDGTYQLETWERVQAGKDSVVTTTSPISDAGPSLINGQILETRGFEIEESPPNTSNDQEAALRQLV